MRFAVAALAALLMSAPAMAQGSQTSWTVVGMKGGAMGWETLNMKKDAAKNTVTLTRFTYFATPKPFGETPYSYLVQEVTFACNEAKFMLGGAEILDISSDVVGTGEAQTAWRDTRAGTPEGLLEGVACKGVTVANTKAYREGADALVAAVSMALP